MKRILVTGMSGVGKSTVIAELSGRGYHAIDADSDGYSHWVEVANVPLAPGTPVHPDRDWVWREDRIAALLARQDTAALFLGGCAANMRTFLPRFDAVILLSAPAEIIVERLARRSTNTYGKSPDEVARVLDLIQTVEPLLRRVASHEIDTRAPVGEVVAEALQIAGLR